VATVEAMAPAVEWCLGTALERKQRPVPVLGPAYRERRQDSDAHGRGVATMAPRPRRTACSRREQKIRHEISYLCRWVPTWRPIFVSGELARACRAWRADPRRPRCASPSDGTGSLLRRARSRSSSSDSLLVAPTFHVGAVGHLPTCGMLACAVAGRGTARLVAAPCGSLQNAGRGGRRIVVLSGWRRRQRKAGNGLAQLTASVCERTTCGPRSVFTTTRFGRTRHFYCWSCASANLVQVGSRAGADSLPCRRQSLHDQASGFSGRLFGAGCSRLISRTMAPRSSSTSLLAWPPERDNGGTHWRRSREDHDSESPFARVSCFKGIHPSIHSALRLDAVSHDCTTADAHQTNL